MVKRGWAVFFAALFFAASSCSSSTATTQLPTLGKYQYSASHARWDGGPAATFTGSFALTYAAADSIAGVFSVMGYAPAIAFGGRIGDGYYVVADPDTFGKIYHQFRFNGSSASCDATRTGLIGLPSEHLVSVTVNCALIYIGQ